MQAVFCIEHDHSVERIPDGAEQTHWQQDAVGRKSMATSIAVSASLTLSLLLVLATARSREARASHSQVRHRLLRLEPISERIYLSASPFPVFNLHEVAPALYAPAVPGTEPVLLSQASDSGPASTDDHPTYGASITTDGLKIDVIGTDALAVQSVLATIFAAGAIAVQQPSAAQTGDRTAGPAAPITPRQQVRRFRDRLPALVEDLEMLERLVEQDVPSALNKIRFISEKVLYRLCVANGLTWGEAEPTLERMKGPLVSGKHIPKDIAIHLETIQRNASPGSHFQERPLSSIHLESALNACVGFLAWYAEHAE